MKTITLLILYASIFSLSSCRFFGCNDVECIACPEAGSFPILTFNTRGKDTFTLEEIGKITFQNFRNDEESELRFLHDTFLSFSEFRLDHLHDFNAYDSSVVSLPSGKNIIIQKLLFTNNTPTENGGCCGICAQIDIDSILIDDQSYSLEQLPITIFNQ